MNRSTHATASPEYPIIGRGTFSTVYRKDTKTVLIHTTDPVKECMSMGWFPDTPLFPRMDSVGEQSYESDYYLKIRAPKRELTVRSYRLYKELRRVLNECPRQDYRSLYESFSGINNEFRRERDALLFALDALANYGEDIRFEISPRNIARTPRGRLVLLDCFFMASHLKEVTDSKRRRRT